MKKVHELKTWSKYFKAVIEGRKTFDFRVNDKDFKEGDTLILKEWDPDIKGYTGAEATFEVGFILQGEFGLSPDQCIMSLLPKGIMVNYFITSNVQIDNINPEQIESQVTKGIKKAISN